VVRSNKHLLVNASQATASLNPTTPNPSCSPHLGKLPFRQLLGCPRRVEVLHQVVQVLAAVALGLLLVAHLLVDGHVLAAGALQEEGVEAVLGLRFLEVLFDLVALIGQRL